MSTTHHNTYVYIKFNEPFVLCNIETEGVIHVANKTGGYSLTFKSTNEIDI